MALSKPSLTRLRQGHPLAQGLVLAYNFNEGSGTVPYDSSNYQSTATASGTASWTGSQYGSAINVTSGAAYSTSFTQQLSNFTCIGIFQIPSSIPVANARVLDKTYNGGFWLGYNPGKTQIGGGCQQTSSPYGTYTNPTAAGTWCVLAQSRLGTNQYMYLNGAMFAGPVNVGSTITTNAPLQINQVAGGGTGINTAIAQILIYNRALSASEIAQHYQDPYQMFSKRTWNLKSTFVPDTSGFMMFF